MRKKEEGQGEAASAKVYLIIHGEREWWRKNRTDKEVELQHEEIIGVNSGWESEEENRSGELENKKERGEGDVTLIAEENEKEAEEEEMEAIMAMLEKADREQEERFNENG